MGFAERDLKGKWSLPVGKAVDNDLSQQPHSRIYFGHTVRLVGSQFPDQGSNLGPWQ